MQRRALVLASVLAACHHDTCLDGTCGLPCADLAFTCQPAPLYVGRAGDAPPAYRLVHGNAGDDDTLISNGLVTAVISAIDAPNDLAPTGGNLIDFGPAGGTDDLTIVYQLAGILPDDAFAYRSLTVEDRGTSVGITLVGALDGRAGVHVATHYELASCDPGLRVRSELFNGSADTQAFFVADATHWGKRRVVPFAPVPHQGYQQPELKLLDLAKEWSPYDYVAGATPSADGPGYAAIACSADALAGVNDTEISALGTPMTLTRPGDTLVLERMLVTAGTGEGPARAIDRIVSARAQRFGVVPRTVTGRIVAGGLPFGGDVRRASVLVRAGDRPVSAVVPDASGRFAATVSDPAPLSIEVWSFGRQVATMDVPGVDVGDVSVTLPGTVHVAVTSAGAPAWAMLAFHPADDATRAAVTGTFHGRLDTCAPWLGPPHGASPACNRALVAPAGEDLEVPAGSYHVFATGGPETSLATADVTVVAGEIATLALAIAPVDVAPAGWLSADLHVHGRASFDSGFPDEDRVKTFAASGVSVIAATDHDVIGDYSQTVAALGLDDRIAVMGGLETTQLIPWLDVPGETVPRVIGHFNFWPLRRVPGSPRAGAPWDERIEPGELFDRMAPLVGDGGMMMLNHPWDEPLFGRDLGYLRAIKFDPRRPIGDADPTNGVLLHRPAGGHRNLDWNIIEIINGADFAEFQKGRVLWAALLAQGFVAPGAGNSDSHGMTDAQLGWARNWVDANQTVATFDAARFDAAVRDGRMIAGNGVAVTVEIGPPAGPRRGLSLAPYHPQPGDIVAITVKAAPWIPVDEVRVVTSGGTRILASGAQLLHPADPLGTTGTLRYQAQVPVASLLTGKDDFVIVEAGLAYALVGDLDGDGVPDTSDNNGDGVVDKADVPDGDDTGPMQPPADPTDPADPRYLVTRVIAGAWPEGFANPLLIDVDGDGWTPPGLP